MSEMVMTYGEMRRAGRHAIDEDAALTPIFHALNRGGRRGRQQEPRPARPADPRPADPVDEFRRDPLTAPIPVRAFSAAAAPSPAPARPYREVPRPRRRRPATHALAEPHDGGRHHHRLESAGARW